jgi:hypothetical protein
LPHPEPSLEWCWLGDRRLTDPFFEDTVTRAFRQPYSVLFRRRTSLKLESNRRLRLAGFIFHVSRCGSTLISRALATIPDLRVYSEPRALDGVLRSAATDAEIRSTILAFALEWKHAPKQTAIVIKFDCWHISAAERIARIFPQVPLLFVFRDPVEVLASQLREPGAWTLWGNLPPNLLGMSSVNSSASRHEYCARALAHFLTTGAGLIRHGLAVPIDYRTLPEALHTLVLPTFGLQNDSVSRLLIEGVTSNDVKRPWAPFSAENRPELSPELSRLCRAITAASWKEVQYAVAKQRR